MGGNHVLNMLVINDDSEYSKSNADEDDSHLFTIIPG